MIGTESGVYQVYPRVVRTRFSRGLVGWAGSRRRDCQSFLQNGSRHRATDWTRALPPKARVEVRIRAAAKTHSLDSVFKNCTQVLSASGLCMCMNVCVYVCHVLCGYDCVYGYVCLYLSVQRLISDNIFVHCLIALRQGFSLNQELSILVRLPG